MLLYHSLISWRGIRRSWVRLSRSISGLIARSASDRIGLLLLSIGLLLLHLIRITLIVVVRLLLLLLLRLLISGISRGSSPIGRWCDSGLLRRVVVVWSGARRISHRLLIVQWRIRLLRSRLYGRIRRIRLSGLLRIWCTCCLLWSVCVCGRCCVDRVWLVVLIACGCRRFSRWRIATLRHVTWVAVLIWRRRCCCVLLLCCCVLWVCWVCVRRRFRCLIRLGWILLWINII